MADPLHKYTVQEGQNLSAYSSYKSANVTINATSIGSGDEGADWESEPAKKVIIKKISGDDANTVTFKLKIGGSYGDAITMLLSEFPLTIDKLPIQRMIFSTSDTATDEVVQILSFH